MTEDSNPESDERCLANSPSTAAPSNGPNQSDSEGSISSIDLVGVDISRIEINSRRAPIRCRWVKCGQWFPHLEMLAAHVTHAHAVAGRNGLFYCGWEGCARGDRGFNARYKMLVHVRTHTNEKPHHCFQCDKSFSRAENLKIHARSHTGERPYVCPVPGCSKAYSNSSDRFKHTRTHSVDKPYVCKVPGCPKRYTDPSSLRKHVKTYRHFPSPQATSPDADQIKPMETNDTPAAPEIRLLPQTKSHPLTSVHNISQQTERHNLSSPDTHQQSTFSESYLSTPRSQPFPAWPGLLPPTWYDTRMLPWSLWQTYRPHDPHSSLLLFDSTCDAHSLCHRQMSPPVDEEQDRPLDLTVRAE